MNRYCFSFGDALVHSLDRGFFMFIVALMQNNVTRGGSELYEATLRNLTAVQVRCTELLEENRRLIEELRISREAWKGLRTSRPMVQEPPTSMAFSPKGA